VSKKIRVGVLFGGKSAEHEVSLLSAKNVIESIDSEKYEVIPISISKSGEWFLHDNVKQYLLNADDPTRICLSAAEETVTLVTRDSGNPLVSLSTRSLDHALDVIFPVLHGTYGEDGTMQGLLKLANIPFVGSGVLASAVGMDKDVMKRLLRDAKIVTAKFLSLSIHLRNSISYEKVATELGTPFFVKPSNQGSSIGISKIKNKQEFESKLNFAFQFDRKILFEECIVGREIECSVLGNTELMVSLPGEIIPKHEFHSYEEKYFKDGGAVFEAPACLSQADIKAIQAVSMQAYEVLGCEGMARVDMFLKEDGTIVLNEVNTIPGFTKTSMYPKMWEASGVPLPQVLDRLIELALERHTAEKNIKTTAMWANEPVANDQ